MKIVFEKKLKVFFFASSSQRLIKKKLFEVLFHKDLQCGRNEMRNEQKISMIFCFFGFPTCAPIFNSLNFSQQFFAKRLQNDFYLTSNLYLQQKYIWTSGRLCDFKGCDRPDLQPTSVNGWFWTAELQKLAPTTDRRQNDWSENGGIGQPQPDNRELQQGGAPENCLAILNNFYNDGVHWVRI